jgi:hypothetical protein
VIRYNKSSLSAELAIEREKYIVSSNPMQPRFKKVKTTHHILPEFYSFLLEIEKLSAISRIIPGRISRQQKGSSEMRFNISYLTPTGMKGIMSKGSTAQELFIICREEVREQVKVEIEKIRKSHL